MARSVIVVVHGIGSQKKGQVLADVLEPLVQFLRKSLGAGNVALDADLRPEYGAANGTIKIGSETWDLVEGYWAQSFHPLPSGRVLLWSWALVIRHGYSIAQGVFPGLRTGNWRDRGISEDDPVYRTLRRSRRRRLYDGTIGALAAFVLVIGFFPIVLAATAFYLFSRVAFFPLPDRVRRISTDIVQMFVASAGDMVAIMASNVQSASIEHQVKDVLNEVADPSKTQIDRLVILAHSAGATVAYRAIAADEVWSAWADKDRTPSQVTLMTFGSSLNLAWEGDKNHPMWNTPLPQAVRWVDLWARYDPIPHGPAKGVVVDKLTEKNAEYVNVRVVNNDSVLTDHVSYWQNHPEVISRIVHEVTTESSNRPIQTAVEDGIRDIKRHRRWIARAAFARLGAIVLAGNLVAGLWIGTDSNLVLIIVLSSGMPYIVWQALRMLWIDPRLSAPYKTS